MKKTIFLTIVFVSLLAMAANAAILWDWDTLSPASTDKAGSYIYLSVNSTGVGIGGSNCLEVNLPVATRSYGVQFGLMNFSGAPGSTTVIDLSANPFVDTNIMATDTSPFGLALRVTDTSGSNFFPAGGNYSKNFQVDSATISTTAFDHLTWQVNDTWHVYLGTRPPDVANLIKLTWFLQDNVSGPTGPVSFYFDDFGTSNTVPVELSNFEAIEAISNKGR